MNKAVNEIFIPVLVESGKRKLPPQITFAPNEICSPRQTRKVSPFTNALYINLSPKLYAVAVSPNGKPFNLKGGLNYPLESGRYSVHYVSREQRQAVIPKVSETTADGAQVSLELIINYRVADPVKALEVEQPVESLIAFIKADLQEYIRSHAYDEILGDSAMLQIDNNLISRYIKEKHNTRHQLSKLFFIADVAVEERTGDPKLMEIRGTYQLEQRQNIATRELTKQKQELEKKLAVQEADIKRIRAEADAKQQDIMRKMELQNMQLERARADLQFRQDRMQRALDAVTRAFSSSYPKDPREVEIINQLLHELGSSSTLPAVTADGHEASTNATDAESGTQKLDSLTDKLLRWLDRKPS